MPMFSVTASVTSGRTARTRYTLWYTRMLRVDATDKHDAILQATREWSLRGLQWRDATAVPADETPP